MATIKAVVLAHHRKNDGTYNVKLRLTHKGKQVYLNTPFFVVKSQMNRRMEVTDSFTANEIAECLKKYRRELDSLGNKVDLFEAKDLATYIESKVKSSGIVDFIEFSRKKIAQMKVIQPKRARVLTSILNNLVDFVGKTFDINFLTSKKLREFENYLRTERVLSRANKCGNNTIITKPPLTDCGVAEYMAGIQKLFNDARNAYNDEEIGLMPIPHNPFKNYRINRKKNRQIHRTLTIEQVVAISKVEGCGRIALARDVFMLSFMFCGMNTADIYRVEQISNGRLVYNRSKTKERKADRALISIKIEPEHDFLLQKYRDNQGLRVFRFYSKYKDIDSFNQHVNIGLKKVAMMCRIDNLSTYYARHSWASIARNDCGVSKDDIAMALSHSDMINSVTDIYIAKDWRRVDEANRLVLDFLNSSS